MDLLLYFALPIATIILAVVFQKIIRCPILVAAAAFDASFLIFAIVYTILAYLAAAITRFICNFIGRNGFFKNINAENINTNTLSANNIELNDDDDENNSGCGCNCNNRYYQRRRNYRF